MKVGILGAGAYGTALGEVAKKAGNTINYYDPLKGFNDLNAILSESESLILCTPAMVLSSLIPNLPKDKLSVIASKGFLSTQPFKNFKNRIIISGPGFAADIKAGKKTKLTATNQKIEQVLGSNQFIYEYSNDEQGILMCGALKNVYAILAGYLNLEPEPPSWQKYINEASREIQALLSLNSANPETFNLSCGIDDLKLTCGPSSRNYQYGQALRKDKKAKSTKTVEGLTTLKEINKGKIKIPERVVYLNKTIEITKEALC
jgi:glycerol-3-phosphate dehydrogenase (NAD(P)+)